VAPPPGLSDAACHGAGQLQGPHNPRIFAERLAAREMLRQPRGAFAGLEPLSLQWFLAVEGARHGQSSGWLPRLLELEKHSGEIVLGLGPGLGTDWVQYARHGAKVFVCCPSAEHLALVRKNFEVRGLSAATYAHAGPSALPFEPASVDMACLSGALHEAACPQAVVDEVYRVLKPGGKVLALAPARYDIDFWWRCCFPWHARAAAAPEDGPAQRFSARSLRRLFCRFNESRVYKRQLRRREVPHLWRWAPLPLLERLMGRHLVFKGFKPLSAAITDQLAA
jgi:ubiquinone/menaquinone biosynthesis C-methylase UbiE